MLPSFVNCETHRISNLSPVKTTNYVFNCLNASESKKNGGYLGIMVDKDDYVLVYLYRNYNEK